MDAPVGGQAVLEGVMMRGVGHWALAVRRKDGTIAVQAHPLTSVLHRHRVLRLPVVRGFVALVESLRLGVRALAISANEQQPDDAPPIGGLTWAFTVFAGFALAAVLFFVLPVSLTALVKDELGSATLFWVVEGVLRTAIFLTYLWVIAKLDHLRRVFQFHAAEHQAIHAYEAGVALTPEEAARFPRLHPRCGTSFLLVVMVVAVFVFAPLGLPDWWMLVLSRLLGIPLVAGLAFEAIKLTGRHRHERWAQIAMWPGMQLQRLTTAPPEREHLEVAVAALQAVLDREDPRAASAAARAGIEVAA